MRCFFIFQRSSTTTDREGNFEFSDFGAKIFSVLVDDIVTGGLVVGVAELRKSRVALDEVVVGGAFGFLEFFESFYSSKIVSFSIFTGSLISFSNIAKKCFSNFFGGVFYSNIKNMEKKIVSKIQKIIFNIFKYFLLFFFNFETNVPTV